MIRLVLFDVDDTIVDTFASGWAKFVHLARKGGLPSPDLHRFHEVYGRLGFEDCVDALFGPDVSEWVKRAYDGVEHIPPSPLACVPAVVESLRADGVRAAVLTNGPRLKTERKLAAVGLEFGLWAGVRCQEDGVDKSNPDAYLAALDDLGVPAGEACFVGDSASELAIAATLGMLTVGIAGGSRRPQFDPMPHIVVHSVDQVPDVIRVARSVGWRSDITANTLTHQTEARDIVSFDAGGTLIDHKRSVSQIVLDLLGLDSTVENDASVRRAEAVNQSRLRDVAMWQDYDTTREALLEFYTHIFEEVGSCDPAGMALELFRLYTSPSNWRKARHAETMVSSVRATGLDVAVVSNWPPDLGACLVSAGWDLDDFIAVVASTRVGIAKPDRRIFDCSLLGSSRIVAHVGDRADADVSVSLQHGCAAVLIEPENADATVQSILSQAR